MTAYAGIGANIGDPVTSLREAVNLLDEADGIVVTAASPVYRNPPVGPQDQPDFYNAVLELEVTLSARDLLNTFLKTEKALGRVRDIRWGPRTIDLDILIYGDHLVDEPGLTVPHPHMLERSFVLVPLADLAAGKKHPVNNRSFLDLANAIGREDLQLVDATLITS